MLNNLFILWLAAFPLMGSPGPATLSLASLGATFGFRNTVRYLLGIIVGTTAVLLVVAAGVTTLLVAQPAMLLAVQIGAALYILYLAWKIATAPTGRLEISNEKSIKEKPKTMVAASFVSGFGLAIANPKAFAAISAVFSGHVITTRSYALDSASKIVALTLVIVIVNTAWLAFGATFSRFLTNPKIAKFVNIVFALLLVISMGLAFRAG